LQTFFHRYMDEHNITTGNQTSALFRALGKASDFFFGDDNAGPTFAAFRLWVNDNVIFEKGLNRTQIKSWLPSSLRVPDNDLDRWISTVAYDLLSKLEAIRSEMKPQATPTPEPAGGLDEGAGDDGDDDSDALIDQELLEFLATQVTDNH